MYKISNFILSNKHNTALPGEKHQAIYLDDGTYNPAEYSGPGTRLDIRIPRNDPGLSYIDRVAKRHDLEYLFSKNENDVKLADEHMIEKLNEARSKNLDSNFNINQAELIRAKYYLNRAGVPTSFFTSFGKDSVADQSIIPEAERQLASLKQSGYGRRPYRLYHDGNGRYFHKGTSNRKSYVENSKNYSQGDMYIINLAKQRTVRRTKKDKLSKEDEPSKGDEDKLNVDGNTGSIDSISMGSNPALTENQLKEKKIKYQNYLIL